MSNTVVGLTRKEEWDREWGKWYARYSKGFPRIGTWIELNYPVENMDILEIGAGSARESLYLARRAKSVTCTDFSDGVINAIQAGGLPQNVQAVVRDGFELGFPAQSFDLTFHKGFWVLFDDDKDVAALFREQLRVTRKVLLALVHNARNLRMVEDFAQKGRTDPLYQVRFFDPDALSSLLRTEMASAGYSGTIAVRKFGGVGRLFKLPCPAALIGARSRTASALYKMQPWSRVESAVIEVRLTNI